MSTFPREDHRVSVCCGNALCMLPTVSLKILRRKASKGWDLIKLIMSTIMGIKWKWLFFFLRLSAWRGRTQWLLEWFDATVLICAKAAAILPTTASAPVMRQQPGAPGKSHLEFCEHSLTRGLPVQDTRSCWNATDREIFHHASQKRNSQWLASCLLATYTATEKIQEHSKITRKKN